MGIPCRALLAAVAFGGLSGCAVGPDYDPPAVAVPKVFGTATLTPAVAGTPASADFVRWWSVFHDPQLEGLIAQAVACNPNVEIALTHVQQARELQTAAFGAMLPTVGGDAGIAAGTGINLMIGRISLPLVSSTDLLGVKQIDRAIGFDAGWEIDLFGKNQRAFAAARRDAEARLELRNAVLITVIAEVARNYLAIRALQMRLDLARRDIATAQKTVDLAVEKLGRREADTPGSKQAGQSSKQESKSVSNELILAVARGDLATQQAKLPELAAAISAAKSRLALLLDTYAENIDGAIRGPAKLPHLPERLRPGVPVDLLRRRPDIRAAERELAAATERIGVATADLFPSVTLVGGFGGQGTNGRVGELTPLRGPIWSVGPRVYWPLLDFGRLDALINVAEMHTHEALVHYKKTILAAVEDVDQAIRQYRFDLQRWKALATAQEELRRAVNLTMERYRRGDGDLRAVLDVQRRYYAHADLTATAEESAVLRYVAFYKALGGGWELYDDLPPVPPVQPAVVAGVRRLWNGWHWH